jgi:hypothetical protein
MEAILEPVSINTIPQNEFDAQITARLIRFHDALVERGQLPPAPPAEESTPQS